MNGSDDRGMFTACRARVDALLDAGAGLQELERTIEALPITTEAQCALWLGACARVEDSCSVDIRSLHRRRQTVIDRLIALG